MLDWLPSGDRQRSPSISTASNGEPESKIASRSNDLIDQQNNYDETKFAHDDSSARSFLARARSRRSATMDQSPATAHAMATSRPVDIRRTATSLELNAHDLGLAELRSRLRISKISGPSSYRKPLSTQNVHDTANEDNGENIYDTFTGAHIGTFDQDILQDEMWTHLSKIRQLQGEIATMHLQMEGLGSETRPDKAAEDGELENAEEAKSAKEQAFSQLENRFIGKKDAVNAIMLKLDILSQTLKAFHSLPNPDLEFSSPVRENTLEFSSPRSSMQPSPPAPGMELISHSLLNVIDDKLQANEVHNDSMTETK